MKPGVFIPQARHYSVFPLSPPTLLLSPSIPFSFLSFYTPTCHKEATFKLRGLVWWSAVCPSRQRFSCIQKATEFNGNYTDFFVHRKCFTHTYPITVLQL